MLRTLNHIWNILHGLEASIGFATMGILGEFFPFVIFASSGIFFACRLFILIVGNVQLYSSLSEALGRLFPKKEKGLVSFNQHFILERAMVRSCWRWKPAHAWRKNVPAQPNFVRYDQLVPCSQLGAEFTRARSGMGRRGEPSGFKTRGVK